MISKKYFLVGMPASGKSTIGKIIADQLNVKFLDLDEEIVDKEKMSITDIFAKKGEAYFRDKERQCLLHLLDYNENYILATGGGAPCFFNNMDLMNNYGTTIFLDVALDDLFNKLSGKSNHKRPLLKNLSIDDLYLELKSKLEGRKIYYDQSKICLKQHLNDIDLRVKQVIEAINLSEK